MAVNDKILIGDSQNRTWRTFDKQLLFDGVNDRLQTIELTQQVRVGKSFTVAFWCNLVSFNNSIFGTNFCFPIYSLSTNNLGGTLGQMNEIFFRYTSSNNLGLNIYARNGATDEISGFAILGGTFEILTLNEPFHVCMTNDWDGTENNWKIYLNGIKVLEGLTDYFENGLTAPTASGINLPPDPNYIAGAGFVKNRNNGVTGYINSKINEFIAANVAISGKEVRELFHCSAGNYANYPANLMSNRILHLPMNNVSDFIDNGIGNPISVINLAPGGNASLTGQSFPPTLTNFY